MVSWPIHRNFFLHLNSEKTYKSQMSIVNKFFKQKSTTSQMPKGCIVVVPDKFKGTLSANEVSTSVANAIKAHFSNISVKMCPMADGGEGSATLIATIKHLQPHTIAGYNALMQPIDIRYYANSKVCAVDSADIVGLTMLGNITLTPWLTTSYGIGRFIVDMLEKGFREIIIGIGGTASIDCGIGMLQALGARFFDVEGDELTQTPLRACNLSSVYTIDFSNIARTTLQNNITVLSDVDVPLIPGKNQNITDTLSALSFAPQKGVKAEELPLLRNAMENFATAVDNALYTPAHTPRFQGAGGGLGYALHRVLKCNCHSGAKFFTDHYNVFPPNQPPLCIITGEGCFDEQSLGGKVVGTLYNHANSLGIQTLVLCGKNAIRKKYQRLTVISLTDDSLPTSSNLLSHNIAVENLNKALPSLLTFLEDLFTNRNVENG